MQGSSLAKVMSASLVGLIATSAFGQDAIWEDQQRVQAQQAEENRLNEAIRELNEQVAEDQEADSSGPGYAPNSFVSFPPEAWADWVRHSQETHRQEEEKRFAQDPAYRALKRGTWTYHASGPEQSLRSCAATFWTRNGGVSFIHLGGGLDLTLLGFFGARIPSVKQPRTVKMELIQSGEVQRVRALNIHFGSVKSMGMVLFNVHTPATLIGAIEDRQDFELRLNGETIAKGAWHSGLKARDKMTSCLKGQGYLARK
ncbi:MAG: hypothetical protein J0H31_06730 [Alphaproteobacteria bacterium]|nr:hypothetical protein [Alphaproteobacteria bacterium]